MAGTVDALVRLDSVVGADHNTVSFQVSSATLVEFTTHRLRLGAGVTTRVNLGGIFTSTKEKWLFVDTDRRIKLAFQQTNITVTRYGNALANAGVFMARLTNTDRVWLYNPATTPALVRVACSAKTS